MRILSNTIVQLVVAVIAGAAAGFFIPEWGMKAVLVLRDVCGQVIFFLVPLIIVGFVGSSVASLAGNVSRLILAAFWLAYVSSVGAALMSAVAAYPIVPLLDAGPAGEPLRALPEVPFRIDIPPVLGVMSALFLALLLGVGALGAKAGLLTGLLAELRDVVLRLVRCVLMPVLPVYVAANFCTLAFEGNLSRMTVFVPVVLMVIAGHVVWLALLYGLAAIVSRRNSLGVLRHYGPAYLTAVGTMSSAATLGVALRCARRSRVISPRTTDFAIPLFANIHLCGSVLTETFFVCVVSQLLYGHLPAVGTLVAFVLLLGVFAVGAPGVPGGTVLASLGIVVSVLGFDDAGTAMLIAVFALQDSFGTACNVTADGALALILDSFKEGRSPDRQ